MAVKGNDVVRAMTGHPRCRSTRPDSDTRCGKWVDPLRVELMTELKRDGGDDWEYVLMYCTDCGQEDWLLSEATGLVLRINPKTKTCDSPSPRTSRGDRLSQINLVSGDEGLQAIGHYKRGCHNCEDQQWWAQTVLAVARNAIKRGDL